MRHPNGRILCDYCHADTTGAYLMCDRVTGEWCRECFADCPLPLTSDTCWGEGCPTLVAEAAPDTEVPEAPADLLERLRVAEAECDARVDATEFYEEFLGRRLALSRAEAAEAALQRLVTSLEGNGTVLTDEQEAAYEAAASLLDELPTSADHQLPKPQST